MGNEGLSPEEAAVWREFDRIATLPADQLMPAFVANQLAPGVQPPPQPPGPPPPWMATRPGGLRMMMQWCHGAPGIVATLGDLMPPGAGDRGWGADLAGRAAAQRPRPVTWHGGQWLCVPEAVHADR